MIHWKFLQNRIVFLIL
ncbi:hypothetical protein RDI58_005305 [Solanum bulbocastanum]|uniref:Uncharacterized protein n=1 Tax=Solanum bulbocastanum TaxID=147425 RepID=A0AAN8U7Z6_SOLBU